MALAFYRLVVYLRPLKKKGFKEERVTTIGLYAIGTSTTLESNKSHHVDE